jgi:uncharacterized protein YceH (UPF0502 family)
MDDPNTESPQQDAPRWQPLSPIDRRVIGVLMEKAKTTPDAYPMTLNGAVTGCNQKSNRWPLMNLEPADVEESLDRLREKGAVGLVQGYGRVSKYRQYMYEWLDVDKVEFAVMAELLLRGPQTEGDLRGRASRMEPIRDVAELRPVLASLKAKGLIVSLTPEGRGHMITHALYPHKEFERVKAENSSGLPPPSHADTQQDEYPAAHEPASTARGPAVPSVSGHVSAAGEVETLRREVEELRSQLSQIRSELHDLAAAHRQTDDLLQRLRTELGS